jgi:hypothetical protein
MPSKRKTAKVINVKHGMPDSENSIYIGRRHDGTMNYGNPFSHNPAWGIECKTREESIMKFRLWLQGKLLPTVEPARRQWILDNLEKLRGKDLCCFCKPLACHGDVLIELLKKNS